jgi:dihydroorotase
MSILVRQTRIIDPSSPFHHQTVDILIENGTIRDIGQLSHNADTIIEAEGLHASPGWVDVFAHFCDPGFEFRETLETGARSAAAGGYTAVMTIPNTNPVVHNKAAVEYLVQKSRLLPVTIHPIAAITRNAEGKELAEMYDMHTSGAVAFSDGTASVQSSGLLMKALQYVKAIDRNIIQLPEDRSISASGLMSEGIVSTRLGLPGAPAISEELMIGRDLELVRYTDSRIHITGISSASSVDLIRKAKASGTKVTCSVTPYHLYFCDEDLSDYDTNLKVNPPLRTRDDRTALLNGVLDGTIDCIASHHLPQDRDHKIVEFEYAKNGMIGLETAFSLIRMVLPQLSMEAIVTLFSQNPRTIFGLPAASINKENASCITLFQPERTWMPGKFQSKSQNSPFAGTSLTGKPFGIINQDKLFLNESK